LADPWYERYFTADYWTYATAEYTASRTAAEVAHLAGVLPPGGRVLDLGCGIGRHAIGLARLGFQVVGLEVSSWALRRAGAAAAAAGVEVEWQRVDLLRAGELPAADAAVCVQAFGWGTDADQLRMLRAVRRALRPGGVLVLDHSNVSAILRIYQAESHAEVDGTTFRFRRHYDAATGRSGGDVLVRRPDGTVVTLPDDVRLYQPPEVRELLVRAGFEVSRVDADFTPGADVRMDTRYVQFVATVPAAPRSALDGHREPAPTDALDLRWAVDEVDFVRAELDAAWASVTGVAERARRYDLADPYLTRLAPVVAAHFGVPIHPDRIVLGAGATGLLRSLAGLAVDGCVLADPIGHPELPLAAAALGVRVHLADLADPAAALAAISRFRPAVTVVDRPGLRGPAIGPEYVRMLAGAMTEMGGVLVVDETCAAYLPPAESVIGLCPGLVVIRGLAKGYCCGGLRVGFAVSAADVAARVRAVAAPLAVSAVSVDVAEALLRRGDVLRRLRAAIADAKPEFVAMLQDNGFQVEPADPRVPWVLLPGDPDTRQALRDRRVVAKEVPVEPSVLRLSVPLSADRRARAFAVAEVGA
jgi:histidinol-phosphate/aromatic aminotransferase/cobyric acid decarboxylase-like protein/SAM-dependent methyltransferase